MPWQLENVIKKKKSCYSYGNIGIWMGNEVCIFGKPINDNKISTLTI